MDVLLFVKLQSPHVPGALSTKESLPSFSCCAICNPGAGTGSGEAHQKTVPAPGSPSRSRVMGSLAWSWLLGPGARWLQGPASAHHKTQPHSGGQVQCENTGGGASRPSLWHLCCLPDWVSEEPSGTPASAEGSSPVQEGPEGRCVCGALGRPLRELCNHSVGPSRALRCLRVLSCSWGRQWSQPLSLTLHQVAEHGGCVTEASPLTEHGLLCKAFPVCLPPAQSPGLGSHTSCF